MKKTLKILAMVGIGLSLVSCDLASNIKGSTDISDMPIETKNDFLTGTSIPSDDLGKVGDTYLNITTYDVYLKKDTGWVLTSQIKDQGNSGNTEDPSESSVRTGSGAPLDTLGNVGDSYIDLVTFNYYVKDENGWNFKVCLKGSDSTSDFVTYIPCVFYNEDGTKLYETYIEKGKDVTYEGIIPTKADTTINGHVVHWRFNGWDNSLEGLDGATIFKALFDCYVNVTFRNSDGTILETKEVSIGDTPVYEGEEPTKESQDTDFVWTFEGWDKPLESVIEDTVYTAKYSSNDAVEVVFENYDGTILGTSYCAVGSDASYKGYTPYKPSDYKDGKIISYNFFGWDKSLTNITESTVFKACFMQTISYECTFLNYDGSLLGTQEVRQNEDANYYGSTPLIGYVEKISDGVTKKFTFSGWDKDTANINEPTTFIACYNEDYYYECKFLDYEGNLLDTIDVKRGGNAYSYSNVSRRDDVTDGKIVRYYFDRWNENTECIYKPTTFKPIYTTETSYECKFLDQNGVLLDSKYVVEGKDAYTDVTFESETEEEYEKYIVKKEFKGWDNDLKNIGAPTTFVAQFKEVKYLECKFLNINGELLYRDLVVEGGSAKYSLDKNPETDDVEKDDVISRYTFTGWDKATTNILEPTEFVANYEEYTLYRCKFVNYDNTLLDEKIIAKNGSAKYSAETPSRDASEINKRVTLYTFTGWDNALTSITKPTTFKAQFSEDSFEGYLATYVDEEDNVLLKTGVKSGEDAYYSLDWSKLVDRYFSYDNENVTMWVGWDKSEKEISESTTFKVKTKTISRHENGEYPFSYVTDDELIKILYKTYYDNSAEKDNQGYCLYNGEKYYYNGSWQKVEPIKWRYMSTDFLGNYQFVSSNVLTSRAWNNSEYNYEDGSYANNYAKSDIRKWLNNDFINQAFYYNSNKLVVTEVDNSINSMNCNNTYYYNQYLIHACQNTKDKVYLLSYQDINNKYYGFVNNQNDVTNYKISYGTDGKPASYWLRSAGYDDCYVYELSFNSNNGSSSFFTSWIRSTLGIRPACTLNLGL